MKLKIIFTSILFFGIVVTIFSACSSLPSEAQKSKTTPTPLVLSQADMAFAKVVESTDLNSGITIQLSLSGPEFKTDKNIAFIVLNHTNETITFPDQGFGFELYWFNQTDLQWEKQKRIYTSDPVIKQLPAKVEKMDFQSDNIWPILADELDTIPHNQLRLFVSGKGMQSGKIYGAYLDFVR